MHDSIQFPCPELDAWPDLKAEVMRLLLTEGHLVDAVRRYCQETGARWEEAERIIKPLDDAVRAYKATIPIRPNEGMEYTLANLDDINWWVLEHAYGAASDVPGNIRALISGNAETRMEALDRLFATIAHQGSVYGATVLAVPFLEELVRDPTLPEREGILQLLQFVAFNHYWVTYEAQHLGYRWTSSEVAGRVYEAVRAGIPTYLYLLAKERDEVWVGALTLLCHFPDNVSVIVPHIRRLLDTTGDPSQITHLVFSLAYFPIEEPWALDLCDDLLADDTVPTTVHLAAAIARTRLRPRQSYLPAIQILAAAAARPPADDNADELDYPLMNQATSPSTLLGHVGERAALAVAPILLAGLQGQTGAVRCENLAHIILSMLFTNSNLPREADPPLATARAAAIRAISGHPTLANAGRMFESLCDILPGVFWPGAFGQGTSPGHLAPEQHLILQALLHGPQWARPSLEIVPVAQHLLSCFFAPEHWNPSLPAASLTEEQRSILTAIASTSYWQLDPQRLYGTALPDVLRSFILPDTQDDLQAYLRRSVRS